jgi:hypothetical protein
MRISRTWTQCVIVFVLVLGGAGRVRGIAAPVGTEKPLSVSLERTLCYGTCPSYVVTLFADGRVTFEGREYVKAKGAHSRRIPATKLAPLYAKIEAIHFWDLQDSYRFVKRPDGAVEMVTDLPTYFVTVKTATKSKRVQDYHGSPKELRELEELIDTIAGVDEWIGKPGERK